MGLRPTPVSIRDGWYSLAFVLLVLGVFTPLSSLAMVLARDAPPGRAFVVSIVAITGGVAGVLILRRMRREG